MAPQWAEVLQSYLLPATAMKKGMRSLRTGGLTCLGERVAEGRLRLRDHGLDLPIRDLGARVTTVATLVHLLEL